MNIKTTIKDINDHRMELLKKGWNIVIAAVKDEAKDAVLCAVGNPVDELRGIVTLEIKLHRAMIANDMTEQEWRELKQAIYAERASHELWSEKKGGSNDE
jgi:hypothetical protein